MRTRQLLRLCALWLLFPFSPGLRAGLRAQTPVPSPAATTQPTPPPQMSAAPADASQSAPAAQSSASETTSTRTVLRTTVRRVVLDVVVTGRNGEPVGNLTKEDFTVTEDGAEQRILSFDPNGFSAAMDYEPPKLPPQPANTFINLPATPEKGPLYVLLYDLTNMDSTDTQESPDDHHIQLIARQQMMKFIQSKPEGARFAIFVRTDGVYLVQGFTSDKEQLYRALDPHHPRPHIPMVFLMGTNFGRGDKFSALETLHTIATFLDGLPGRKNLIWFSSAFPLSFFADENDGTKFKEETRSTMDLLAHNQIAVYPVDARGVSASDARGAITDGVRNGATSSSGGGGGGGTTSASGSGTAGGRVGVGSDQANSGSQLVLGPSMIQGSYSTLDEIAKETGGHAFYGTNDLASELVAATNSGSSYYTLTYSSTNKDYDGRLRNVDVQLKKKGPELAFRHFYYATESGQPGGMVTETAAAAPRPAASERKVGDTLSANMQEGAPMAHQLVFVLQAKAEGTPEQGTPEQMAELATEPAYFKVRHHNRTVATVPPIALQKHLFTFEIPTRQFKGESTLSLELAAAVYNAEGQMMNAVVRIARKDLAEKTTETDAPRFFRVEQELEVPLGATTVRFAVRDTANDRTGAMEESLPLAPPANTASMQR